MRRSGDVAATRREAEGESRDPERSRHLLVLTQVYHPEPNFITADVAEALARHMRVTVITAHPNYPFGRFYPGTRFWRPVRTEENGVTVWRLPLFPDHSLSRLRRAASYLSFALLASALAPFLARRVDTVWVYHGAFTTGLAALWFRFVARAHLVYTCADLWPESFEAAGVEKSRWLLAAMYRYRRALNRAAHTIVCCTRGTFDTFLAEGVPPDRLGFVPV